jgi:hypothetical protein
MKHTNRNAQFLSKIERTEGCWNWLGHLDIEGYGMFFHLRRSDRAHRVSYETFIGPIPDGLVIDHLCFNKACVNPLHLEPVTIKENTRRFYKTLVHCPNGHEYTPENVRIRAGTIDTRVCKACDRVRVKNYKLRKLA